MRTDWSAISAELRREELADKACESLRLALEENAGHPAPKEEKAA